MCESNPDLALEPGLDIDEIEKRLVSSAERYHQEERRIAFYLLEVERRNLFTGRGFSSIHDFAKELLGFKRRKTQYLLMIARALENYPEIDAAFEAGEIGWPR